MDKEITLVFDYSYCNVAIDFISKYQKKNFGYETYQISGYYNTNYG
jgi:hypothetical protein